MPSPVPVTSPADFLGLEVIDIVLGYDRRLRDLGTRRLQSRLR
ncbi:hypothetical protein [Bradyrhizobium sp.]